MNLTNRRPNWFLFWGGLALVGVGIWLALVVSPERAPFWVQKMWSVGYTRILGTTPSEARHGSVSGQIWRGREVFPRAEETRSRLEFRKTATREEAANADSRVDGRTVYRVFWLGVGFIGVLMMFFGLGTSPTLTDRTHLGGDVPTGGGATQPSGSGSTSSAKPWSEGYNPFWEDPAAFAQVQTPAQPGQEDRTESAPAKDKVVISSDEGAAPGAVTVVDDSAELYLRWTDKGPRGEQSSHELVVGGAKLDKASSVQVFFDLKNGTLLSAKPTVNFERSGDK